MGTPPPCHPHPNRATRGASKRLPDCAAPPVGTRSDICLPLDHIRRQVGEGHHSAELPDPSVLGRHACNGLAKPTASRSVQQPESDRSVASVLLPCLRGLEHQGDLRSGIPQPVRRDPRDVVEIFGVGAAALIGPAAPVSGVKGTSKIHGEYASRRAHTWLSGRTSLNLTSKGRNHPSSTFQGVHWSPRKSRNFSASLDRIETSMSSCCRGAPVKASMLQPPMIHHGRSKPSMNAAIVVGLSGSHPPYQRVNSSGGR